MKKYAPFHVKNYCTIDKEDEVYKKLVNNYEDDHHFVYKIRCSCCNDKFKVYKDDHPTVVIKCSDCDKEIIVYDLKYYPAAIKLDDKLKMEQVSYIESSVFNIYSIYEYCDEFDEEIEFVENDITWCLVFIKCVKNKKLIKLIDDETA